MFDACCRLRAVSRGCAEEIVDSAEFGASERMKLGAAMALRGLCIFQSPFA
jgi:hypothetical protein